MKDDDKFKFKVDKHFGVRLTLLTGKHPDFQNAYAAKFEELDQVCIGESTEDAIKNLREHYGFTSDECVYIDDNKET